MRYITIKDLSDTIRANIYKIPHDVDFVIGVPRSGMLAASIISEFINVPLIDVESFCKGLQPTGGLRLRYYKPKQHENNRKKVIVVEDTICNGTSMKKTRSMLSDFSDYDFIYLAVYLEGPGKNFADIYLEDVRPFKNDETVIYEWNIFHQNENVMINSIWDFDGVICKNPPDERNENEYLEYIKNAIPLFVPTSKIGAIATYRLIKNQEITIEWLNKNNVQYNKLHMFNANTWEERNNSGVAPWMYKGYIYKNSEWSKLFIESSDYEAFEIFKIAQKPVFCVESNKMYY